MDIWVPSERNETAELTGLLGLKSVSQVMTRKGRFAMLLTLNVKTTFDQTPCSTVMENRQAPQQGC